MSCFALRKGKCSVLTVKTCEGCGFYKTMKQYKNDQRKALKRLTSLNRVTLSHISETYYGGKMPLLKGGDK